MESPQEQQALPALPLDVMNTIAFHLGDEINRLPAVAKSYYVFFQHHPMLLSPGRNPIPQLLHWLRHPEARQDNTNFLRNIINELLYTGKATAEVRTLCLSILAVLDHNITSLAYPDNPTLLAKETPVIRPILAATVLIEQFFKQHPSFAPAALRNTLWDLDSFFAEVCSKEQDTIRLFWNCCFKGALVQENGNDFLKECVKDAVAFWVWQQLTMPAQQNLLSKKLSIMLDVIESLLCTESQAFFVGLFPKFAEHLNPNDANRMLNLLSELPCSDYPSLNTLLKHHVFSEAQLTSLFSALSTMLDGLAIADLSLKELPRIAAGYNYRYFDMTYRDAAQALVLLIFYYPNFAKPQKFLTDRLLSKLDKCFELVFPALEALLQKNRLPDNVRHTLLAKIQQRFTKPVYASDNTGFLQRLEKVLLTIEPFLSDQERLDSLEWLAGYRNCGAHNSNIHQYLNRLSERGLLTPHSVRALLSIHQHHHYDQILQIILSYDAIFTEANDTVLSFLFDVILGERGNNHESWTETRQTPCANFLALERLRALCLQGKLGIDALRSLFRRAHQDSQSAPYHALFLYKHLLDCLPQEMILEVIGYGIGLLFGNHHCMSDTIKEILSLTEKAISKVSPPTASLQAWCQKLATLLREDASAINYEAVLGFVRVFLEFFNAEQREKLADTLELALLKTQVPCYQQAFGDGILLLRARAPLAPKPLSDRPNRTVRLLNTLALWHNPSMESPKHNRQEDVTTVSSTAPK